MLLGSFFIGPKVVFGILVNVSCTVTIFNLLSLVS
jgi:hypothetical protein